MAWLFVGCRAGVEDFVRRLAVKGVLAQRPFVALLSRFDAPYSVGLGPYERLNRPVFLA